MTGILKYRELVMASTIKFEIIWWWYSSPFIDSRVHNVVAHTNSHCADVRDVCSTSSPPS